MTANVFSSVSYTMCANTDTLYVGGESKETGALLVMVSATATAGGDRGKDF